MKVRFVGGPIDGETADHGGGLGVQVYTVEPPGTIRTHQYWITHLRADLLTAEYAGVVA